MSIININIPGYKVNDKQILNNINIQIDENDCLALTGLNGAGKTSLIKLLLDFAQTNEAEISINKIAANKANSREDVYYLPEKFNPADFFTGYDYLTYVVDAYKVDMHKLDREKQFDDLAKLMDLDTKALSSKIKTYSKGMVQKLGIISAVLSEKNIWILDEPMTGLDPLARSLFYKLIEKAKADGKTIIICTHMLGSLQTLCNKLSVIHAGEAKFYGAPAKLIAEQKTENLESAFLKLIAH